MIINLGIRKYSVYNYNLTTDLLISLINIITETNIFVQGCLGLVIETIVLFSGKVTG